jgi:hypothetical protein
VSLRLAFVALALLCLTAPVRADEVIPPKEQVKSTYGTGEKVCGKLSLAALTGQSPWLVMGVGGGVEYLNTPDERKARLGVFAQPWVWGPMLVLVLLVAFKDTILTVFSQLKMPLDALAQALHAVGAVFAVVYLGAAAFGDHQAADPQLQVLADTDLKTPAPSPLTYLGSFALWLLMCGVHAAVWVVFNTVEVVILLNPVPFVDTALKAFRTAVVGVISGAAALHPVFGFVLALPVILLCLMLVPFALRMSVVGWVFTRDVIGRLFGAKPQPGAPVTAFTALAFPGVPVGICGTVQRGPNGLEFVYRRWFVLWKRRIPIPWERVAIASGGVLPRLIEVGGAGGTWLRFPPRYRKMEAELAVSLGLGDVHHKSVTASLGKLWRRVWDWVGGKRPVAAGPEAPA